MARRAASLALLFAVSTAIAACAPDKVPKVETNVAPTSRYKAEIVDALRPIFAKNDTTSISDAAISDPLLRPISGEQHYISCVRYTAHYATLKMTTTTERIAYFYGGHLNQLIEATKEQCGNAAYKPFAELNELCIGKGCK